MVTATVICLSRSALREIQLNGKTVTEMDMATMLLVQNQTFALTPNQRTRPSLMTQAAIQLKAMVTPMASQITSITAPSNTPVQTEVMATGAHFRSQAVMNHLLACLVCHLPCLQLQQLEA